MASSATEWDPDDTSLMLHMDGADASTTFTDETGKTVTANGNAQIDTAQSKFGGAAALFDGAGDYLTVSGSADWDLGTGDFTIDFWFRSAIESPNIDYMLSMGDEDLAEGVHMRVDQTVLRTRVEGTIDTFAWTPAVNTWYHVALVRNGNNLLAFIDGTQVGTTQDVTGLDVQVTGSFFIAAQNGSEAAGNPMNGWLDEFRIVKGTAVWTANFTSPTAAYTKVSATISKMMLMGIS